MKYGFVILLLVIGGLVRAEERRLIVISDVDDTIKYTYMKGITNGNFLSAYYNNLHPNQPFVGMPELYQSLKDNGAEFHYVTNTHVSLKPLHGGALKYFPDGEEHYKKNFAFAKSFKTAEIKSIIENSPDADIILVGDNGQKDQVVFESLLQDPKLGKQIKGAFVHRLYDNPKLKSGNGITHFLTAASLAVQLRNQNLINTDQFERVMSEVDKGLSSRHPKTQKLTLPYFTGLKTLNLAEMFPTLGLTPRETGLVTQVKEKTERRLQKSSMLRNTVLECLSLFPRIK